MYKISACMNKQYVKAIVHAPRKIFKNLNHAIIFQNQVNSANTSSFLDRRRKNTLNKIINILTHQ